MRMSAVLVAFSILFCSSPFETADALPRSFLSIGLPQPGSLMRPGRFALAPLDFIEFCHRYPADCPVQQSRPLIELTPQSWALLKKINMEINLQIRPLPVPNDSGPWQLGVAAGDCKNYAIEKRHVLLSQGFPAAALALAEAITPWGANHLVLTVRTSRGTQVLDNLRSAILPWSQTGYRFIKMQSPQNVRYWVSIDGDETLPAALSDRFADATIGSPVQGVK